MTKERALTLVAEVDGTLALMTPDLAARHVRAVSVSRARLTLPAAEGSSPET